MVAITSIISPSSNGEEHSLNISAASEPLTVLREKSRGDIPVASTPDSGHVASNVEPGFQFPAFRHLNKYELTVVLDKNSVVDDPLLDGTYKGLICTAYEFCINPKCASHHLHEFHSQCKVGTTFQTQLVAEMVDPPEIFCLAIPIEERSLHSLMSSSGIWQIPSGMSESARICWNVFGWSLSHGFGGLYHPP
jgi:hypothetical protein